MGAGWRWVAMVSLTACSSAQDVVCGMTSEEQVGWDDPGPGGFSADDVVEALAAGSYYADEDPNNPGLAGSLPEAGTIALELQRAGGLPTERRYADDGSMCLPDALSVPVQARLYTTDSAIDVTGELRLAVPSLERQSALVWTEDDLTGALPPWVSEAATEAQREGCQTSPALVMRLAEDLASPDLAVRSVFSENTEVCGHGEVLFRARLVQPTAAG